MNHLQADTHIKINLFLGSYDTQENLITMGF